MQLFGTRCSSCRPIQGGFYQRRGATKSIPYELNNFIQQFNQPQNKSNDKTHLWNCRSYIDWSVAVEIGLLSKMAKPLAMYEDLSGLFRLEEWKGGGKRSTLISSGIMGDHRWNYESYDNMLRTLNRIQRIVTYGKNSRNPFRITCQPVDNGYRQAVTPLFIGSICKLWRDVAWSTPLLWNTILLHFSQKHHNTQIQLLGDWRQGRNRTVSNSLRRSSTNTFLMALKELCRSWLPDLTTGLLLIPSYRLNVKKHQYPQCWHQFPCTPRHALCYNRRLNASEHDFCLSLSVWMFFDNLPTCRNVISDMSILKTSSSLKPSCLMPGSNTSMSCWTKQRLCRFSAA